MIDIKGAILASIEVKKAVANDTVLVEKIRYLAKACTDALANSKKIILAGNGGSFADAQHIAAEFVSRYMMDRDSLPAIALGCNNSAISAIGNDYGYENVFARELSAIGNEGDVFIAISTSGNSQNILKAIEVAKEKKLALYGLTGGSGGRMVDMCECIVVPSIHTGRIQECHIMIGHIICAIVEETLFKGEE